MEQLSKITFCNYGEVLSPTAEPSRFSKRSELRTVLSSCDSLSVSEEELLLIPSSDGAGILHVQKQSTSSSFLFTSPVKLFAGIQFGISALGKEFACDVYSTGPLDTQPMDPPFNTQFLEASVSIPRIYYTLLQEKERGYLFAGETHDFYELTYINQGHLFNTVDGETFLLKQGEMQFFLPGQKHTQYGYQDESVSFFSIAFDIKLPERFLLTNALLISDLEERRLLLELFHNTCGGQLFFGDKSLCLLTLLILHILRRLYDISIKPPILVESSSTNRINDNLVEEVLRQIRLNPTIKVSELARRVSMSSSYLSRMIVQRTGQSISSWRKGIRLDAAKELLRKGISVTDAANQLHYPSVGYLSSEFKKAFGVTPREYSKSLL